MLNDSMPGHWYEDYERGRPGYPETVVDLAAIAPSATVLELAAGTGKLTRRLVSRFARVVAVEPDPGMRRLLRAGCPAAQTVDGAAERIPLPDDSVDAVFVAQAFHWFDTEAALTQIARVLRPGGALVVIWNVANGPIAPPVTAVGAPGAQLAPRLWVSARHDERRLGTRCLARSVGESGLRPDPAGTPPESPDGRPDGTGRLLRLHGVGGEPSRRGAASTPRRGEIGPSCGRIRAAVGDPRAVDRTERPT